MEVKLYYKVNEILVPFTHSIKLQEYYVTSKIEELKVFLDGHELELTEDELLLITEQNPKLYHQNGVELYDTTEYLINDGRLVLRQC